MGSIPGLGRSPGERKGNPPQYSYWKNPMDRKAWWAIVFGVPRSQTQLSEHTYTNPLNDSFLGRILRQFLLMTHSAKILPDSPLFAYSCTSWQAPETTKWTVFLFRCFKLSFTVHWWLSLSLILVRGFDYPEVSRNTWVQNEAGQRLTEFCQENALVIANTLFQQHRRLYTWTLPYGQHQNQTDCILCSQKWRSSIQSAKTRPGADCGSDHELLIAKFRLKLKKVEKTTRPFRYDLTPLRLYSGSEK